MKDLRDYSLLAHNTFGIDVKCSRFLEYETTAEAQQVADVLRHSSIPYIIIGEGSNLLLTRDFPGIVVHSALKGWEINGNRMLCGSGEAWDDMVEVSLHHGLYGAENLSLIPGDVGASAVQNIGAYGVEVKDLIVEVHAIEIALITDFMKLWMKKIEANVVLVLIIVKNAKMQLYVINAINHSY